MMLFENPYQRPTYIDLLLYLDRIKDQDAAKEIFSQNLFSSPKITSEEVFDEPSIDDCNQQFIRQKHQSLSSLDLNQMNKNDHSFTSNQALKSRLKEWRQELKQSPAVVVEARTPVKTKEYSNQKEEPIQQLSQTSPNKNSNINQDTNNYNTKIFPDMSQIDELIEKALKRSRDAIAKYGQQSRILSLTSLNETGNTEKEIQQRNLELSRSQEDFSKIITSNQNSRIQEIIQNAQFELQKSEILSEQLNKTKLFTQN